MALDVITSISLDMQNPYSTTDMVHVNQYDSGLRVKATLLNAGQKWEVPSGAKAVVAFKKSDNIGGFYDATDDDPSVQAVSIDNNRSIIYISLDAQTTTTPTTANQYVDMQVVFYENGKRLSTFAFYMDVRPSIVASKDITSNWVFHILAEEIASTLNVATTPDAMREWLETNIHPYQGYPIDDTLTVPGAASDAAATGKRVTVSDQNPNTVANKVWVKKTPYEVQVPMMDELINLKTVLSANSTSNNSQLISPGYYYISLQNLSFVQGRYAGAVGGRATFRDATNRICSVIPLYKNGIDYICWHVEPGYNGDIIECDANGNIIKAGWFPSCIGRYMIGDSTDHLLIMIRKTDDSTITASEYTALKLFRNTTPEFSIEKSLLAIGGWNGLDAYVPTRTNRLSSPPIRVYKDNCIKFIQHDTFSYGYYLYNDSGSLVESVALTLTEKYRIIAETGWLYLSFRKDGDPILTVNDYTAEMSILNNYYGISDSDIDGIRNEIDDRLNNVKSEIESELIENNNTNVAMFATPKERKITLTGDNLVFPPLTRIYYDQNKIYRIPAETTVPRMATNDGTVTEEILTFDSETQTFRFRGAKEFNNASANEYVIGTFKKGLLGTSFPTSFIDSIDYTFFQEQEAMLLEAIAVPTGTGSVNNAFAFIHFSDIHGQMDNSNNRNNNIQRIYDFYTMISTYGNIRINDIIHTGDSVYRYFGEENPFATNYGNKIINIVGNHDCWEEGTSWYNVASLPVYNKFFKDYISSWGVVQPNNAETNGYCYFYKDYTASNEKLRIIFLDALHYNAAQNTWFVSVLTDAATNNISVIVASHYQPAYGVTPIQCSFTNPDITLPAVTGDRIERISNDTVLAIDNFQNNGGTFVCWLTGHSHRDCFGTITNYSNQLIYIIDTAGQKSLFDKRISKTKTQDCFNVFVVDTKSKLLKIVRIGKSYDRYLRHVGSLCYNYEAHQLISNS